MKKVFAIVLALTLALAVVGCAQTNPTTTAPETTKAPETTAAPTTTAPETTAAPTTTAPAADVMTYEQFAAAAVNDAVVVECYIVAVESWYKDACHIYALAEDGGYYIYGYACTEAEAAELVPGMKIRVSGFKAEWSGEVEIVDATIEKLEGTAPEFTAEDVSALSGDELAKHMNDLVAFNGMTVVASTDANGKEVPYLYKWDGSGSQGDDLYFNVSIGENVYTFTVNAYMIGTGADSDVYKAVEALQIGDKINIEGFLYYYNAPQTHVTSVTAAE